MTEMVVKWEEKPKVQKTLVIWGTWLGGIKIGVPRFPRIRRMAAPVLQIAATLVPQHISDIVLTFILTDPLAAQAAAAGLSKAW